jgi:putative restriction endonuclease
MTREERALQIWQVLIGSAHNRQTLTYRRLGQTVGLPARGLGPCLELVSRHCRDLGLPQLTVLAVSTGTGKPAAGLVLEDVDAERERVFEMEWYKLEPRSSVSFTFQPDESTTEEG